MILLEKGETRITFELLAVTRNKKGMMEEELQALSINEKDGAR